MTTKEHVHQLVERIDADGLDVDRLNEDQLSALERDLSSILLRFGRRDEPDADPEVEGETNDDPDEDRPYDPLGKIIDLVGDDYEGPTDVSSDKYRHVADAIEANWARD